MADDDYFIDGATVSILEAAGASSTLVALLLAAIGDSEGIDSSLGEVSAAPGAGRMPCVIAPLHVRVHLPGV